MAGWNQSAARTTSSIAFRSQSDRFTCSSSWHAIAVCSCSGNDSKLRGTSTTGQSTPQVTGLLAVAETRNSASVSASVAARSMESGRGQSRRAERRRRPTVMTPRPSQPSRRSTPATSTSAAPYGSGRLQKGRGAAAAAVAESAGVPTTSVAAVASEAAGGSTRTTHGCSSGNSRQPTRTMRQYAMRTRGDHSPSSRGSGAATRTTTPAWSHQARRLAVVWAFITQPRE